MKKNNKTTVYILLPAVIVIWGLIVYRIFGNPAATNFKIKEKPLQFGKVKDEMNNYKDFDLILNYEDPFLGNHERKAKINDKHSTPQIREEQQPAWPSVTYQGCIGDNHGFLAHLTVNNQIFLSGTGQLTEDIDLLKIRQDSILVKFNREQQWFKK